MVIAPIICKNSCHSLKIWQCDWKHSNTHVITKKIWFENLEKCEKKIVKEKFDHFVFGKKNH
jgi:hypothetical protein